MHLVPAIISISLEIPELLRALWLGLARSIPGAYSNLAITCGQIQRCLPEAPDPEICNFHDGCLYPGSTLINGKLNALNGCPFTGERVSLHAIWSRLELLWKKPLLLHF